jgi:hypothetical protein
VKFSRKPCLQFFKSPKLSDITQEFQTVELVFTAPPRNSATSFYLAA